MQENLFLSMPSKWTNTFHKNNVKYVNCASFFSYKIQFLDYLKVDSAIKLNAPLTTFSLRDLLPVAVFSVLLLNTTAASI